MKRLTLLAFVLLPFLVKSQDISQHFKAYDIKKQKTISLDDIVADMANADVLFFGEEHNDSIGHYLEVSLFKKLATAYNNKVGLTLEMFHTDVQPVINEYLAGIITEKNFTKEARAWNNYKDYKPMIEFAKTEGIAVIGGNAAARYSNSVTKNGLEVLAKLPTTSKQFLPPNTIDTLTGRYYDKFIGLLGGHSMGDMKVYQTQNFWDATMAWSIAKFAKENKGKKIFQVNGRFHSDEKLGTYAQLKKIAPKLKTLNIAAFAAEDFANPDWEKHKDLGDYVILTDPKVKKSF
ncbi:MAG: ChaN family lipoprotein [Pedobacter sp.]|uniref:ChaN family lipoprotein n=1 Tax=Pedobacter sp. TaxID=1411316 RepID=UPI00280909F3|nr:ChaN family lipoprotein [Pedobacter sp.]MDQ8003204.1 ChaN family lipoprotein [Pedobacter sp.]